MVLLEIVFSIGSILLLLLTLVVFMQVIFAYRSSRDKENNDSAVRPSFAVIIPAHNEEVVLADTLKTLIPQVGSGGSVLVVADNCTDKTAIIAEEHGAIVVERKSTTNRGKGYALEFGLEYLESSQLAPEYVLFVDADCLVREGSIDSLIQKCAATNRPVQALYLMRSPAGASIKQKIAEFAWLVKNHVRPLGMMRLGLPCQLMGTGMAFPLTTIREAKLGTSHIVEDMKLGIELACLGKPPVFCPDALVESSFPEKRDSINIQRKRWEHGHISIIMSNGPVLLKQALTRLDKDLLAMTLDLVVPPLALLVSVLVLLTVLCVGAVLIFDFSLVPLQLLLISDFLLLLAIALAWYRFGRTILSMFELLWIPIYVVSKVPVYIQYWVRRQSEWIRSDRE